MTIFGCVSNRYAVTVSKMCGIISHTHLLATFLTHAIQKCHYTAFPQNCRVAMTENVLYIYIYSDVFNKWLNCTAPHLWRCSRNLISALTPLLYFDSHRIIINTRDHRISSHDVNSEVIHSSTTDRTAAIANEATASDPSESRLQRRCVSEPFHETL